MIKHYFVIEHVYDHKGGNSFHQTWIFASALDGGPVDVWLEESLQADASIVKNPSHRAYDLDGITYCVGVIKKLTKAEYNFLKEIGIKVMA